jgi:hypothetical protein
MPELDDGLAALARHGERTARLEPVASIRFRADRRRRRRYTAAAALGLVAAVALGTGIAVAQPDRDRLPPLTPTISTSPVPSTAPPLPLPFQSFAAQASSVEQTGLRPRRVYRVVPAATDRVVGLNAATGLALDTGGRFGVKWTGKTAEFSFEEIPGETGEWLIRLDEGDGSRCVSIATDGLLGLDRCDSYSSDQRTQLWRGADDAWGRPSYGVVFTDQVDLRWLTWDPATDRLTMAARPSADRVNGWVFVDEGPSDLEPMTVSRGR